MSLPWHLYLMGTLLIVVGIIHFIKPRLFIKTIPPALGNASLLNLAAGAAEVVLGVSLMIPTISSWAAWGIILLLIAVFPANIYMYTDKKAGGGLPKWLLLLRLPIQFFLVYWAYLYT